MANRLDGKKIALFVEEGFEDSELAEPLAYLREEGAIVVLVGSGRLPAFTGKKGLQITPDAIASELHVSDFDAFVVPGGHAPEKMRLCPPMVTLIEEADDRGKIIAAVCHGPQLLISADVLHDRMATCYASIAVDVKNAGAHYVNEAVVRDGNIITSRTPADLPQFNEAIAEALSESSRSQGRTIVAGA
jgi:protease I